LLVTFNGTEIKRLYLKRLEDVIYIVSTSSFPRRYPIHERVALEAEIIRRCLSRTEYQCSFLEYRGLKIIYRRYASLFFVVAVDGDEEVNFWMIYFYA
jgi:AP-4 complex subunit sigma-1